MEVQFTPEQEARILQIANDNGTPAEQLVKQAALRLVEEDEQFHADMNEAIEQADRGQFTMRRRTPPKLNAEIQTLLSGTTLILIGRGCQIPADFVNKARNVLFGQPGSSCPHFAVTVMALQAALSEHTLKRLLHERVGCYVFSAR